MLKEFMNQRSPDILNSKYDFFGKNNELIVQKALPKVVPQTHMISFDIFYFGI